MSIDFSNLYRGEASVGLSPTMEEYAQKADRYLQDFNSPVTGEMLAAGAQKAYQKYGKVVPVQLALAQLQEESSFGTKGRAVRTKNPYNVGNTDDGSAEFHNSYQEGIDRYYDLMARNYLSAHAPEDLLNNFVDSKGRRYATDQSYEQSLRRIINNINSKINE